ncbi:hypothetical protein CFP56_005644 [Quercus suber]|uniref:Uncharacterized protein n=1 Tax=Quercus suber TaxID=58331 RepID=A0AAW0LAU5_QUESU
MDSDFIERLQRVSLTAEEDEVIMVRLGHRKKTLEEWSLSLPGRNLTGIQRLVVSLASDKAVREVILRNTSVPEFQWTPYAVNELFQPPRSNNPTEGNMEQMEEENRSSLPLSVVILLIVAVA